MHYLAIELLLFSLAAIATTLFTLVLIDTYKWLHLPPGPMPLPFIGNKLSLPKSKPWLQFDKWAKEYGPIYTIWTGRTPTLILTSPTVAHELLSIRSSNFSTRPRSVVLGELYTRMSLISVMPYGKAWSQRRRLFHDALKPSSLRLYKPRLEAEASILSSDILVDGGKNWVKIIDRYTAGIIFTIGYGRRIESMEAEVIRKKVGFVSFATFLVAPGRFWVDTFPWLKYMPNVLVPWKRNIEEMGDREAVFNIELVDLVRSDIQSASEAGKKTNISSFTESILAVQEQEGNSLRLNERDLAALPGTFFTAGFDTTATALGTCLLALITHPEVLRISQAELDALLPALPSSNYHPRSPSLTDESKLPYLNALILETLRWRPAVPLGISHASTSSSIYEEYTIPAATTVIAATWSLNRNPTFYPSPHLFSPARFLPLSHALYSPDLIGEPHPSKSGVSSFGWGRRTCPGEDLAINTLFVGIAKFVWGFEIEGVEGEVVDTLDYKGGLLVRPPSFGVRFRVRSEAHREVLEREAAEARAFMGGFGKFD